MELGTLIIILSIIAIILLLIIFVADTFIKHTKRIDFLCDRIHTISLDYNQKIDDLKMDITRLYNKLETRKSKKHFKFIKRVK